MRIGNYTAQIEPGTEDTQGYVAIKMTEGKAPFTLRLNNHSDRKSKVNIHIHGIDQGTWVLMPYQFASLERPAHIAEKFCAYPVNSAGGNAIGLTDGDPNNGLICITFTPEKRIEVPAPVMSQAAPSYAHRSAAYSPAGVGTEGESTQVFQTVNGFETDEHDAVKINLRIVELKNTPRSLSSALSNSIPPAI
jgi:hypothetical protein